MSISFRLLIYTPKTPTMTMPILYSHMNAMPLELPHLDIGSD